MFKIKNKRNTIVKVLLWIFFPYVMTGINISKKYNAVIGIFSGFLFLFVLIGFHGLISQNYNDDSIKSKTTTKPTATSTDNNELTNKVSPIVNPTAKTKNIKQYEDEIKRLPPQLALFVLRDTFKNIAKVEYIENINAIKIIPSDKNFSNFILLAKSGAPEYVDKWNKLAKNLTRISLQVEEDLSISLINPFNTDNTLFTVSNGIVFYDVIE